MRFFTNLRGKYESLNLVKKGKQMNRNGKEKTIQQEKSVCKPSWIITNQ